MGVAGADGRPGQGAPRRHRRGQDPSRLPDGGRRSGAGAATRAPGRRRPGPAADGPHHRHEAAHHLAAGVARRRRRGHPLLPRQRRRHPPARRDGLPRGRRRPAAGSPIRRRPRSWQLHLPGGAPRLRAGVLPRYHLERYPHPQRRWSGLRPGDDAVEAAARGHAARRCDPGHHRHAGGRRPPRRPAGRRGRLQGSGPDRPRAAGRWWLTDGAGVSEEAEQLLVPRFVVRAGRLHQLAWPVPALLRGTSA